MVQLGLTWIVRLLSIVLTTILYYLCTILSLHYVLSVALITIEIKCIPLVRVIIAESASPTSHTAEFSRRVLSTSLFLIHCQL